MTRRVLFLDIDGVLNSTDWFAANFPDINAGKIKVNRDLCHQYVRELDRVCVVTKAEVVISSAWRTKYTPEQMQDILQRHGFTGKVIGMTPNLRIYRGLEIQHWMTENNVVAKHMAIVDDDESEMGHLMHRLVQTEHGHGLVEERANALITMLGGALCLPSRPSGETSGTT